jgi:hypothetical protein
MAADPPGFSRWPCLRMPNRPQSQRSSAPGSERLPEHSERGSPTPNLIPLFAFRAFTSWNHGRVRLHGVTDPSERVKIVEPCSAPIGGLGAPPSRAVPNALSSLLSRSTWRIGFHREGDSREHPPDVIA